MFGRKKKKKWTKQQQAAYNARVMYSFEVQEYLEKNRVSFMEEWADICGKTNGRVSYEQLQEVLGRNYPKASWIEASDYKAQIKAFFEELGFPCRADETHIYFP